MSMLLVVGAKAVVASAADALLCFSVGLDPPLGSTDLACRRIKAPVHAQLSSRIQVWPKLLCGPQH